jgi:hypothetical protein
MFSQSAPLPLPKGSREANALASPVMFGRRRLLRGTMEAPFPSSLRMAQTRSTAVGVAELIARWGSLLFLLFS